MNVIDNGVKEIISIERVIKDEEMYFEVKFIDFYGKKRKRRFANIKNIEDRIWYE